MAHHSAAILQSHPGPIDLDTEAVTDCSAACSECAQTCIGRADACRRCERACNRLLDP